METDRFYLELALQEAEQAGQEGTYPIVALIVDPDGSILSQSIEFYVNRSIMC